MRKNKKQRRDEKQLRLLTRKLLKEYPFLEFKPWDRNKRKYVINRDWDEKKKRFVKHRLLYIYPFDDGWMKAYYYMMMNEIRDDLIKTRCMNSFMSLQYKEKFGTMHWYVAGCQKSTTNIIHKYERLSSNICLHCGKPDVGYTYGWIKPICKKCYEKDTYNTVPYEEAIDLEDTKMNDTWGYTQFYQGGSQRFIFDISDTAEKIRKKWDKKHKE